MLALLDLLRVLRRRGVVRSYRRPVSASCTTSRLLTTELDETLPRTLTTRFWRAATRCLAASENSLISVAARRATSVVLASSTVQKMCVRHRARNLSLSNGAKQVLLNDWAMTSGVRYASASCAATIAVLLNSTPPIADQTACRCE
jgi:hypothetical protein